MNATQDSDRLQDNLARVLERIAEAARRSGRSATDVRLVAVTKYADLATVRGLLAAGVHDLGESRVQQLVPRAELLGAAAGGLYTAPEDAPRWHMIGHLQRNKVRALLPHARILHSLHSLRLAGELDKQAAQLDAIVDALLEVNVSGEASKQGVPADEAASLAERAAALPHVRVRGLMTMAPADDDPEQARPHFARLRRLLEQLRGTGVVDERCRELSMGMSQDYAVAVEEGATLVRVGSALYEGLARANR